MTRVTLDILKDMLRANASGLVSALVPDAKRYQAGWMASHPHYQQKTPSFQIYADFGFFDHKEGISGSALDHIMLRQRTDLPGARAWAENYLGLRTVNRDEIKKMKAQADDRRKLQEEKAAAERARRSRSAYDAWLSAPRIAPGDAADLYYQGRGVPFFDIPHVNRFDGRLAKPREHWRSAVYAAGRDRRKLSPGHIAPPIIWPVRHAAAAVTGAHFTFLQPLRSGWTKLAVDEPKLMLGDCRGGVACLSHGPGDVAPWEFPADGKQLPVIICEGIETGLSIALAIPEARVWAALFIGNYELVPLKHPCAGEFIFALENDIKPRAVATRDRVFEALEQQLGAMPRTMVPPRGNDFNDTLTVA